LSLRNLSSLLETTAAVLETFLNTRLGFDDDGDDDIPSVSLSRIIFGSKYASDN
jgi:hypothetical protein